MDSQDWSILDEFKKNSWVVLDYPEYRLFGLLTEHRIDRLGRTCVRLSPAWEVGEDKGPDGSPFSSPNAQDCRPSKGLWVNDDSLRRAQLCEERWVNWPGKDDNEP